MKASRALLPIILNLYNSHMAIISCDLFDHITGSAATGMLVTVRRFGQVKHSRATAGWIVKVELSLISSRLQVDITTVFRHIYRRIIFDKISITWFITERAMSPRELLFPLFEDLCWGRPSLKKYVPKYSEDSTYY